MRHHQVRRTQLRVLDVFIGRNGLRDVRME